mmetsp:Transcript_20958/g.53599  ORF Transcript_20958/g.53599 Transcript_20958/m.53599 type:complete len:207 (+) Transcript_20958:776-1396(+)
MHASHYPEPVICTQQLLGAAFKWDSRGGVALKMAKSVEKERMLRKPLWEEALGSTRCVCGRNLVGMLLAPWQGANKHVLDDVEPSRTQSRPERVQSPLLIKVLVRSVIEDDVELIGQRHGTQLLRIGRICLESEVNAWVVPHRAVVLTAKLCLMLDETICGTTGAGALCYLSARFDVYWVDVGVRKVCSPRLHRRCGVLADTNLEH